MSRLNTAQLRTVLYEGPGSRAIEADARSQILKALLDHGYSVTSLRDRTSISASSRDYLLVLGRFAGNPPLLDGGVAMRFQDIDGMDAAAVVEAAKKDRR